MSDKQRLLDFKDQIDTAKTECAEVKGQITAVEQQTFTQFNVKDIPSAEKKLEKIDAKLITLNKQFSEGMKQLEQAHEWE